MKLNELKTEIKKYQYFEDDSVIDVAVSSVIATRLKLGDPIWLSLIGPSSGGKSQILRPLSMTDEKYLHRLDDLTENTFLSGVNKDKSFLKQVGSSGILVMSDLTVLFSKSKETREAILSQMRMIYDGELIKYVGNSPEPIKWSGRLGVIAGCTPSIYHYFEEVADMGERFIYYRLKDYSAKKAAKLSFERILYGKALDEKLSGLYKEYIEEVVKGADDAPMPAFVEDRIIKIALFAEQIRTPIHTNFHGDVDRIPVKAFPMRVALQLKSIVRALVVIRKHDGLDLTENDMDIVDWCGYSLANEEKRVCLRAIARMDFEDSVMTTVIADDIGLRTEITRTILQNLTSVGVLKRTGKNDSFRWKFADEDDWEIVRRLEGLTETVKYDEREYVSEDSGELNEQFDAIEEAPTSW